MNMIGKIKYILILIMAMIFAEGSAQNSQTLYFMNLPQNHLLNPALRPSNSLYIGLPAISGVNLNINNNFVNFSDVFIKGESSDSILAFLSSDYNIDDFLARIRKKSSVEAETTVQMLGLGFSAGKDLYIFIDINDRIDGNFVLPEDLFNLSFKGNESFLGSTIDLSSLRGDFKYYREYGLGASRNFTDKLRIGVKGKILAGITTANVDNRSLGMTVNEDSHSLIADINLNLSGPLIVDMGSDNNVQSITFDNNRLNTTKGKTDFFLGKQNMGFGFDVGATYDISEKIAVSAAITDIGFIRWKKDITNLAFKGSFDFSGLIIRDVINGTSTVDQLENELDSLKNSFTFTESNDPFTTFLPVGVTLGGSYNLTKNFSAGLLSYSRFVGNQLREALTLSGNLNIRNVFSASLSYTITNHRADNLGFGLAFRPGIFQFYLITDRVPLMWNKVKVDSNSTLLLPSNWNLVNFRLGMNLAFGNHIRRSEDRPMIMIE